MIIKIKKWNEINIEIKSTIVLKTVYLKEIINSFYITNHY